MGIFNKVRTGLIAACATAGFAVSANAAIISNFDTQSFVSFGNLFSEDPPTGPNLPVNHFGGYTLQQFDGSLGTLNSVSIVQNQAVVSTIDDTGGNCAVGFSECAVDLARSFRQDSVSTLGGAAGIGPVIIDNHTVNCDLGIGTNACSNSTHARNSDYNPVLNIVNPGDVAGFIGVGTFNIQTSLVAAFTASNTIESVNVLSGVTYDWGGTATVFYDFTPNSVAMPAPAGALFLALGLAAVARRRR